MTVQTQSHLFKSPTFIDTQFSVQEHFYKGEKSMSSETNPKKGSKMGLYIAVAVVIVIIAAAGVFAYTQLAQNPASSPSPSPTQSPTPLPTSTLTPSPTQTLTPTQTPTATQSPTGTPSTTTTPASATPSPTQSSAATPTPTPTLTATPLPTPTQVPTPTPTLSPTPTGSPVSVTIYAGSTSGGGLGFGNSASSITSPGPTLTFKVGDRVTLTLSNTSPSLSHNWAMVDAQSASANVVFGAQVSTVSGGGTGSVTFTPTQAGNYYYICQVFGHFAAGMWGNIVVNP